MVASGRHEPTINEQIAALERRVQERIAELEAELLELRKVAEHLGLRDPISRRASRAPIAMRPNDRRQGRAVRNRPAKRGERMRHLALLVAEEPGITIDQAASRLTVTRATLYPIIRRLSERGQLAKKGGQLFPIQP